ncbi:MAG: DUF362 domain-containing protein [Bacteroidetes bacterium]|nr:DUF362 domain-containing protein [Bacteroidota bacterium]MCL5035299.1 DUF362 domain-containing protein [Bacteroidota bacterium]
MDRRTFVKRSLGASIAFGTFMKAGSLFGALGGAELPYDLVAVKGGEADSMFDQGIGALGGMKSFVRKGDKVVVKPNIGWDVSPERGGNTNPKLVARIIRHCLEAGAKEVNIVDHPCDEWQRCYTHSGIEKAVKDAGGKMVPGGSPSYYNKVSVNNGKALKSTEEHEVILESDVFINVPVLKCHSGSKLTAGLKNMMGNVWDREYWHRTDLHQCIADFATYRKPTLNVLDAYYVMKQNGPRGVSVNDVVTMKAQLISTDIVALDAAGAKLYGIQPDDVRHIRIAAEMKIGREDLENLRIKRITV